MNTTAKGKSSVVSIEALLGQQGQLFKRLLKESLQEVLEAEMTEVVGAGPGERSVERLGYRSGYYSRSLVTRIGKLELRVPRDRDGRFSTELFERYQRSEKALVSALAEMYVQGVSTRKVKAVTEELCGHAFSASTISQINKGLDGALARFASRALEEAYPYLILDARCEKVRIDGVIRSQAVPLASTGRAGARSWALIWPTANLPRVGRTSCSDSRRVACMAWNSSSPTITTG
jgi:transposase-like protein